MHSTSSTVSPIYTPISPERIVEIRAWAADIGGYIHILPRVRVRQGLDWQQSIDFPGSKTPPCQGVRSVMVADLYLPMFDVEEEVDIILFGKKDRCSWTDACSWGDTLNLVGTNPREVFASVGQNPNLNTGLFNRKQVYVVATANKNTNEACCVWIGNKCSIACLFRRDFFGEHVSRYAFREPRPEPVQ